MHSVCPGCGRDLEKCACLVLPSDLGELHPRRREDLFSDPKPPLVLEELDGEILVTLQVFQWPPDRARLYGVAVHPSGRTTAQQMRDAVSRSLAWREWVDRMLGETSGIIEQVKDWLNQELSWAEIAERLNLHLAVYVELGMHEDAADVLRAFQPSADAYAAIRLPEENRDSRVFLKENPFDGETVKKRFHRIGR